MPGSNKTVPSRKKDNGSIAETPISAYFGECVFGPEAMKQYLSKEALKAIDDEIKRNRDAIKGYQGQHLNALRGYGSMTGTNPSITMFTGDGLTTTGG